MNFSSVAATVSLSGTGESPRTNVTGNVKIGRAAARLNFASDAIIYARNLKLYSGTPTGTLALNAATASVSLAYTPATLQVETATAAGTSTLAGNATITVTGSGLTGSPVAVSVAVALSDTAATWAGKVRTALAANPAIAAVYTVGGSTTAISLTRRLLIPEGYANDTTLNIAIANGTCTGISAAATSANTTAGVLAVGAAWDYTTATDADGEALSASKFARGILIECNSGHATFSDGTYTGRVKAGQYVLIACTDINLHASAASLVFTRVDTGTADINVSVVNV